MAQSRDVIRVPNLPLGQVVDEDGMATDDEMTFRQALVSGLQRLFGNEGVVVPTQSAANIITIQNNTNPQGQFTCAFGTILYNSDANSIMIAVDNGAGAPLFKTVTLT